MKAKSKQALMIILLALVSFALAGCGNPPKEKPLGGVTVTVVKSDMFELNNNSRELKVGKDGNLFFSVILDGYHQVSSVSYDDYEIIELSDKNTQIRMYDVKYSLRIKIEVIKKDGVIAYYLNGGEFIDNSLAGDDAAYFTAAYDTSGHLRSNTEIGTNRIRKSGHTLTGWNTQPDGSGETTLLGSRISITARNLVLYAQWSKWTNPGDFTYSPVEGGTVAVTGYNGSAVEEVSIPELSYDGYLVTEISANAFNNCRFNTLVMPKSMINICTAAFNNCDIEQIYFSNNVQKFEDNAFIDCEKINTVHLNAIAKPKFIALDRHSNLPDKYDILIENQNKKKIIVFSGSSAYFSVDTKMIEEEYDDYFVINMAVNGHFNAVAQLDMIMPYLRPGDVFLHVPEGTSDVQFLQDVSFRDPRFISSLEGNLGLISSINLRNCQDFFEGYTKYIWNRTTVTTDKYTDNAGFIDDRGNYSLPKRKHGADEPITNEGALLLDILDRMTDDDLLKQYYKKIQSIGCKILASHGTVNMQSLEHYHGAGTGGIIEQFDNNFERKIGVPVIVSLTDCIYNGSIFFNSDYHLSDEGTVLHTNKIINALRNYI